MFGDDLDDAMEGVGDDAAVPDAAAAAAHGGDGVPPVEKVKEKENPMRSQKLSREERQQRTAERLAKQSTPTDVYGGGWRAGARAQPV